MKAKTFDPQAYGAAARAAACEGAVLLRNEAGVLPFAPGAKVAVFGRSQFNYYKSGTGSGGLVNTGHVPTITEALEQGGRVEVDQELKAVYEAWLQDHPFDVGQGWAAEPWYQEEMPLDETLVGKYSEKNDAALVIIGRTAGEDKDNSDAEGSYLLAAAERRMLALACGAFRQVAVVLNTGSILDMKWVEEYRPGAVMLTWQGGQEGGLAVADLLTGQVTPSGKLSDTIARDIGDYPAAGNYGSESRNVYSEDIYVGYRYFETFAPDKVLYPFGFGLSYTQFAVEPAPVQYDGLFRFSAKVANTGGVSGREVVQLYCAAPQGRLGKPARSLCAFAKTPLLAPGEEATVEMTFSVDLLASYDDSGVTGHKSAWVVEAGNTPSLPGRTCAAPGRWAAWPWRPRCWSNWRRPARRLRPLSACGQARRKTAYTPRPMNPPPWARWTPWPAGLPTWRLPIPKPATRAGNWGMWPTARWIWRRLSPSFRMRICAAWCGARGCARPK